MKWHQLKPVIRLEICEDIMGSVCCILVALWVPSAFAKSMEEQQAGIAPTGFSVLFIFRPLLYSFLLFFF